MVIFNAKKSFKDSAGCDTGSNVEWKLALPAWHYDQPSVIIFAPSVEGQLVPSDTKIPSNGPYICWTTATKCIMLPYLHCQLGALLQVIDRPATIRGESNCSNQQICVRSPIFPTGRIQYIYHGPGSAAVSADVIVIPVATREPAGRQESQEEEAVQIVMLVESRPDMQVRCTTTIHTILYYILFPVRHGLSNVGKLFFFFHFFQV